MAAQKFASILIRSCRRQPPTISSPGSCSASSKRLALPARYQLSWPRLPRARLGAPLGMLDMDTPHLEEGTRLRYVDRESNHLSGFRRPPHPVVRSVLLPSEAPMA